MKHSDEILPVDPPPHRILPSTRTSHPLTSFDDTAEEEIVSLFSSPTPSVLSNSAIDRLMDEFHDLMSSLQATKTDIAQSNALSNDRNNKKFSPLKFNNNNYFDEDFHRDEVKFLNVSNVKIDIALPFSEANRVIALYSNDDNDVHAEIEGSSINTEDSLSAESFNTGENASDDSVDQFSSMHDSDDNYSESNNDTMKDDTIREGQLHGYKVSDSNETAAESKSTENSSDDNGSYYRDHIITKSGTGADATELDSASLAVLGYEASKDKDSGDESRIYKSLLPTKSEYVGKHVGDDSLSPVPLQSSQSTAELSIGLPIASPAAGLIHSPVSSPVSSPDNNSKTPKDSNTKNTPKIIVHFDPGRGLVRESNSSQMLSSSANEAISLSNETTKTATDNDIDTGANIHKEDLFVRRNVFIENSRENDKPLKEYFLKEETAGEGEEELVDDSMLTLFSLANAPLSSQLQAQELSSPEKRAQLALEVDKQSPDMTLSNEGTGANHVTDPPLGIGRHNHIAAQLDNLRRINSTLLQVALRE
jgi:hypothetical protein